MSGELGASAPAKFEGPRAAARDRTLGVCALLAGAAIACGSLEQPAGYFLELLAWALLVALVVQSIQTACDESRRSSGFWADLTAALIVWVIADGLFVWTINGGFEAWAVGARLFGGLGWLATWLAVARQPHRDGHWRPRAVERRLHWMGAIVVGLGLGFYFVGVAAIGGLWLTASSAAWLLLTTLGAVVTLRFLFAALEVRRHRRWRWIYGAMTLACAAVTFSHVGRVLRPNEPVPAEIGGAASVIALVFVALAARLDVLWPSSPRSLEVLSDPVEQGPLTLETPYLGLAAGLPIAHYLAHRSGLLPEALEPLRETAMLCGAGALAAVSLFQQRRLADWTRSILGEKRRVEGRLIHGQRRLQMADERRRAEEALLRAREKMAKAFRASSYAVSLSTLEEGRYLDCNQRFLDVLGYSRREVIDRTAGALGIWADLAERDKLVRGLREDGAVRGLPMRFRRRDGEIRSALVSAEPLEIDGVPSLISLARDLGEEEEDLRWHRCVCGLMAKMPQAVWRLNMEDRVLDANPAAELLAGAPLARQLNRRAARQRWVAEPEAL
ncbi:MAG: PAS domain-containing protein [Acidobacteriota bacterium]